MLENIFKNLKNSIPQSVCVITYTKCMCNNFNVLTDEMKVNCLFFQKRKGVRGRRKKERERGRKKERKRERRVHKKRTMA